VHVCELKQSGAETHFDEDDNSSTSGGNAVATFQPAASTTAAQETHWKGTTE